MLPVSGPKVCVRWMVCGWWWVCKPISVLSFFKAEQLNRPHHTFNMANAEFEK